MLPNVLFPGWADAIGRGWRDRWLPRVSAARGDKSISDSTGATVGRTARCKCFGGMRPRSRPRFQWTPTVGVIRIDRLDGDAPGGAVN